MSASCCGSARKKAALIILLLAFTGLAVWVIQFTKQTPEIVPPVEMVEVVVAAKDIPTGTEFSRDNVDELTQLSHVPRASVPPEAKLIKTTSELIGKRLNRATHQGEFFSVDAIGSVPSYIMEFPMPWHLTTPLIGSGVRVDILASFTDGETREVMTVLPDVCVLALDVGTGLASEKIASGLRLVSVAVDQKQVRLVVLASQSNCGFEYKLPDSPKRDYDYDKTLTRLKELVEKRKSRIAPAPRIKGER